MGKFHSDSKLFMEANNCEGRTFIVSMSMWLPFWTVTI